jgi:hypothetical protein
MKKNFILIAVALVFATSQLSAQQTLIHYWNFNAITIPTAETKSADRNLAANALTPIPTDFTLAPLPSATVIYRVKPNTTGTVSSYWDAVGAGTGSTVNARNSDAAGNALRTRDAWQNMELVLNIPSTGYTNITIKYDVQNSGSGPYTNTYYYSVDGTTWITTGISTTLTNPVTMPSANFATETIAINDVNADNNANLKFKIWFSDLTQTKGNNRFDNITVEATDITASVSDNIGSSELIMSPNTNINGVVNFSKVIDAVVFNLQGRQIKSVSKTNQLITTDLAKGIYVVRLNGLVSKKLVVE